jgi:hypothetical protein
VYGAAGGSTAELQGQLERQLGLIPTKMELDPELADDNSRASSSEGHHQTDMGVDESRSQ